MSKRVPPGWGALVAIFGFAAAAWPPTGAARTGGGWEPGRPVRLIVRASTRRRRRGATRMCL